MRRWLFCAAIGSLSAFVSTRAHAESAVIERDSIPYVMISNLTIPEGNAGLTPFTATLTLSNRVNGLTVRVTATPGTASESDYVFPPTEVTFGSDAVVQTVSGFIVGDTEVEGDETFTLTAVALAGDAGVVPRLYSSGGIVVIKNDDYPRSPTLRIEGVTVLEGDSGTSFANVRVVLDPPAAEAVAVTYHSVDGTATNGQDYYAVEGILHFAPGEGVQIIPIEIVGDTTPEPDETVTVVLGDAQGIALGSSRAEMVIVNDDGVLPGLDGSADGAAEASDSGVYSRDSRTPGAASDALALADSGRFGTSGVDAASGASLKAGCACSLGARRPRGLTFLVGAVVVVWIGRRKRSLVA